VNRFPIFWKTKAWKSAMRPVQIQNGRLLFPLLGERIKGEGEQKPISLLQLASQSNVHPRFRQIFSVNSKSNEARDVAFFAATV
jgi:hypothetical protein